MKKITLNNYNFLNKHTMYQYKKMLERLGYTVVINNN